MGFGGRWSSPQYDLSHLWSETLTLVTRKNVSSSCSSKVEILVRSNYDKIQRFSEDGKLKEALDLVEFIARQSSEPPKEAFVCLLRRCTRKKALKMGKQLHALIIQTKYDTNIFLSNLLISMYSNCDSIVEALKVFTAMPQRNMFSWTAMISAYVSSGRYKEALTLFHQMQDTGKEPNKLACVLVLKACRSMAALSQGQQLHTLVIKRGFDSDVTIQTSLVDMYGRCGLLKDAHELFKQMPQRDVASWNALIAAYSLKGLGKDSLDLFDQMKRDCVEPNRVTFILLLKACASILALEQGKRLHSILGKSLKSDKMIQTTLIDMYAKCGCLEDARDLFKDMLQRDVVSWNVMIAACAQEGLGKEALDLYKQMKHEGIEPNKVTFVLLLKACGSISALGQGKQFHSLILECGLEWDTKIQNSLVDMYAKCGCLKDAHEVFKNMPDRDIVSWNTMIAGYVQEGLGDKALNLYEQMKHEDMEPDTITLVLLLKACASILALERGRWFHSLILGKGMESEMTIQNALVDMYAKCGSLNDAHEQLRNMTLRDVVSWSAMIAGYAQNGLGKEALDLYEQMTHEGMEPNKVTFVVLLKASASIAALEQGRRIHSLILEKGLESDIPIQNSLVDMYAKCGCLEDARDLFNNMNERGVVSWTVMIAGYAQKGLGKEALDLFDEMEHVGMEPNKVTFVVLLKACASIAALQQGRKLHSLIVEKALESEPTLQNSLVDMYAKCGCLKDAHELFSNMPRRDVVSWNTIIAGYAQKGLGKDALHLFEQMKNETMEPDDITLILLLKACASNLALEQGRQLHSLVVEKGLDSETTFQTTLVDMYAKCGCLEDAHDLFDNMALRDVVSWSAMMAGYAQKGLGKEALNLYKEMKHDGLEPDNIALVLLLKACVSIAALEQGRLLHCLILERGLDSEITIQNSLVDMYSKCGCLKDASELFNNVPQRDAVTWGVMIAGYAQEGLGKEAINLYEQMKSEGLRASEAIYTCVLSACSHSRLVDEGLHVFESMYKDHGVTPTLEHYGCIADLLGRAGLLADAEDFILKMPIQPDEVVWMSLLGAARKYVNVDVGRRAFEHIVELKEDVAPYLLLIGIYLAAGRMDEVAQLRKEMQFKGLGKKS